MKKLFFLGALFAVGLGFTACSSDKDVAENSGQILNGGDKYIAIGINLPQAPASATRAGTSDNNNEVTYHDGKATEYAVKNATLIIFNNATNEDDATFVAAYNINTSPWTGGTSNNVTEYSTKVVKLVSSEVVDGYRAMVILNHNNILTVSSDNGLSVNGTALTAGTTTYATFRKTLTTSISTLDASGMTSAGFFMANAPLSNAAGSGASKISGSTRTLVPITANAIYKSEEEAQAGTNYDQIFVERGVAKVTMQAGSGTMSNSKVESTALTWEISGWILDNTAPSTYLIRSTDGDDDFRNLKTNKTGGVFRYIGNTQVYDGTNAATGFWRTYFAQSIGYDKWAASETYALNTYSSGAFSTAFFDASDPYDDSKDNALYCYENTFDVDHQNVKNTTLVQLAITAKNGGSAVDLYTLSGQKSTVYTVALLQTKIKEAAYYVLAGDGVLGTITTADITVTLPTTSVAGIVGLDPSDATKIKVTPDNTKVGAGYVEADFYTNLSVALGDIACYKDGVSYYSIRIKHFGDNLTPWNSGEYGTGTAPSSSVIYPDNASNRNGDYLGRYGVLRNNWYDISVHSVRSLGNAEPHTGTWPDTPDDELDNYLAFRINVLSWAKRTQSVDL